MTLANKLQELANLPTHIPARPVDTRSPSGWEPGVKYAVDGAMTVTLPATVRLADGDHVPAVESMGVQVPEGWTVRIGRAHV